MEVLPSKFRAPPAASARIWFSVRDVTFRGYSLERMEFVEGLGSAFQDLGFRCGLFGFRDQRVWGVQDQVRSLSLYSSQGLLGGSLSMLGMCTYQDPLAPRKGSPWIEKW